MRDALRDVDFSPAHRNRILAATAEDGTGALWHWERGQPVASLELPPGPLCLLAPLAFVLVPHEWAFNDQAPALPKHTI